MKMCFRAPNFSCKSNLKSDLVSIDFFREFAKRMDKDLPFYYWTVNERFQDEELPSFDECPKFDDDNIDARNHPLRLHRLQINQREDGSVLVPGRAILPAGHRGTLRHRMHRPEMGALQFPITCGSIRDSLKQGLVDHLISNYQC